MLGCHSGHALLNEINIEYNYKRAFPRPIL